MGMKAGVVKVGLVAMGLCLAGYILGPPLYWHSLEVFNALTHSYSATCPPCNCHCDSDDNSNYNNPILTIPSRGLSNTSLTDCAKRDPEVSEDTEKNFAELLSEELKLREAEALESQRHADMALLEAKKIASQYQKEADKCNSGMETCEEAREKAESALTEQRRVTAMWEMRARQRGWKEGAAKAQSL